MLSSTQKFFFDCFDKNMSLIIANYSSLKLQQMNKDGIKTVL